MKILSINAGSSSLKFTLFELPKTDAIASGVFEKIGLEDSFYTIKYNGEKTRKEVYLKDHSIAVDCLMKDLIDMHIVSSLAEIEGVGHRIVHGGSEFTTPVILTDEVIERISKYNELGPLHNPANLLGVKAFMNALPGVVNVGVFDTGFHQTMDEEHFLYPVPYEWYTKYGVRKYGFHGTSHRFVYKQICEKLNNEKLKVITCHIGNGASLCAIDEGKVVDTSMGFTPVAGVMMGTRCGDIDSGILEYVCNKTGKTISEVTNDLNKKSGFLGISGISSDARDVENAAMEGNKMAILAENMYAQKIANYIIELYENNGRVDQNLLISLFDQEDDNQVNVLRNKVIELLMEKHHPPFSIQLMEDCKNALRNEQSKYKSRIELESALKGKDPKEQARLLDEYLKAKN